MFAELNSFVVLITYLSIFVNPLRALVERAKDNGDIYIVSEEKFVREHRAQYETTTEGDLPSLNVFDWNEIATLCNKSFSIPMDFLTEFNTTGELPNVIDKTGMCFIRCFYEKSGIIENWTLNVEKIRANIWPATGDTPEVCEKEGAGQTNACVRAYAIAKCLTFRALVDARNKPPE